VNGWDWAKIGSAGAAFGSLLAAGVAEIKQWPVAIGLYTLAVMFGGAWLTMLVVDWWETKRRD
jgi:hypothetical protein